VPPAATCTRRTAAATPSTTPSCTPGCAAGRQPADVASVVAENGKTATHYSLGFGVSCSTVSRNTRCCGPASLAARVVSGRCIANTTSSESSDCLTFFHDVSYSTLIQSFRPSESMNFVILTLFHAHESCESLILCVLQRPLRSLLRTFSLASGNMLIIHALNYMR